MAVEYQIMILTNLIIIRSSQIIKRIAKVFKEVSAHQEVDKWVIFLIQEEVILNYRQFLINKQWEA